MKWLLRIVGGVIALVVLVVAGAAAWVAWFVDVDAYRRQIVAQVRHYTGRDLRIAGDMSVSLLPRIALTAESVSLAARPGFGDAPMLTADSVGVAMQSWPLLRGRLEIDRVMLGAPKLSLGVNAAGETAWGDIVARVREVTGRGAGVEDHEALGAGFAALAVQGIELRDGSVSWRDAVADATHTASGLSIEVDRVRSGEPGRFELSARVESEVLPAPVHVGAKGTVTADFATGNTDIADLTVELANEAVELSLSSESTSLRDVRHAPRVSLRGVVLSAARGDASMEARTARADYDRAGDRLEIPDWQIEGTGLSARGNAVVTALTTAPSAALHVEADRLDPAGLAALSGGEATWSGSTTAAAEADFVVEAGRVRAQNVVARAGDSDLSASFELSLDAPMTLDATFDSRRLDIDALTGGAAPPGAAAAPLAGPLALMQSLHGTLEARVGTLVSGGVAFGDVAVRASADGEQVLVESARANVAGGRAQGTARLGKAQSPPLSARLSLAGVDAGILLGALGVTQRLSGRGDLELDLDASGVDADAIARSLRGTVAMNLVDVGVRGIDIGRILAAARAGDAAEAAATPAGEPVTRFSRFDAAIRFDDGVGTSRDLELVAEGFRVQGGGTVNLPAGALDYRLAIHIARPPGDGDAAPTYEPVPVPLRISGELARPDVSIDFAALMRAEATRRGIEAPDAKKAARDYLRRKLGEALE